MDPGRRFTSWCHVRTGHLGSHRSVENGRGEIRSAPERVEIRSYSEFRHKGVSENG